MKTMIRLFVFLIACCVQAYAQSELPMIRSSGALRSYAFSQAAEVDAGLGGQSVTQYGNDYRTWVGAKSQADIEAQIKQLKCTIETTDTSDIVGQYISVMNKDGDSLFYGYGEGKPVQVNGVWTLPSTVTNISLSLMAVPIVFDKPISYAVVTSKDANGNPAYSQVYTSGNKVYMPAQNVGLPAGALRVAFTDNTVKVYAESDGKLKQVTSLSSSVTGKFDNASTFTDPTTVSVSVKSTKGIGIVPSIEVNMSAMKNVTFDIITTEGKRPLRMWWRQTNVTSFTEITLSQSGPTNISNVPVGTNYFVPEWDPKDFAEPNSPVSNGGGKG